MVDRGSYGVAARPDIGQILAEAQCRWLQPSEVIEILRNYDKFKTAPEPAKRPPSGSLFLFDKKSLRCFRKDGHNWRKKKDGKTLKEVHKKLKVGHIEVLHCYYAHAEENENFQRRIYWMLEQDLMDIVLVHYLEFKEEDMFAKEDDEELIKDQDVDSNPEMEEPREHVTVDPVLEGGVPVLDEAELCLRPYSIDLLSFVTSQYERTGVEQPRVSYAAKEGRDLLPQELLSKFDGGGMDSQPASHFYSFGSQRTRFQRFMIPVEGVAVLEQLFSKYGDLTTGYRQGSIAGAALLELLCAVLLDMRRVRLKVLNVDRVLEWRDALREVATMGFSVSFVLDHLRNVLVGLGDVPKEQELKRLDALIMDQEAVLWELRAKRVKLVAHFSSLSSSIADGLC